MELRSSALFKMLLRYIQTAFLINIVNRTQKNIGKYDYMVYSPTTYAHLQKLWEKGNRKRNCDDF